MKLVSKNNKYRTRSIPPGRNAAAHRSTSPNRSSTASSQSTNNTAHRNNGNTRVVDVKRNAAVNQKANDNRVNEKRKPVSKKKSPVKTALIILLIIVLGFAALYISLGFYVDSLDTIFPNVWADGIKVSGMTVEEATQALLDAGYEENAEGIAVTMIFPDGSSFTVTGAEAGMSLNASEAAGKVFEFGRDGTFFENELTYIRALFNRTDLNDLSTASFDDSLVREFATEFTERFNETLFDSTLEQNENYLLIVKGTGMKPAVEDEVFNLAILTLLKAVTEHDHLTVEYIPEADTDDAIDLQLLFDLFHVDPVSSRWDVETLSATASSSGKTFDFDLAYENLRYAINGERVEIPVIILEPEMTREQIESMIFRDVLSERTTRERSNDSNRIRNIEIAAGYINGTVLNPGEVFSFNEVVGARTTERGFKLANVIQDGILQPGVGGGICQVSSTLYDALLYTHLEVVERRTHRFTIAYLPPGHDATVAYNQLDFKFKNNTDFPIRIETAMESRNLTVRLIGTKLDDTYIEIEVVDLGTTPVVTEHRETEDLLIGQEQPLAGSSGIPGRSVEVYQVHFSADGVEIGRTRANRSNYSMQPNVILVGTRPPGYVDLPVDGGGDYGTDGGDVTIGD